MFRIYKEHTKDLATRELLSILAEHPEGISTSALSGTPHFHGSRTLSNRQIIKLLKDSGKAICHLDGYGKRTFYRWQLRGRSRW